MQQVSTLDSIDVNLSCPFASGGDIDSSFLSSIVNGVTNVYATKTSEGGTLLTRTMVNTLGYLFTTDLFMSKIGCLQTYVQGMSYPKYAKLEYVDKCGVSHTLWANGNNLGNFNNNPELIANLGNGSENRLNKWVTSDSGISFFTMYFN